MRRWPTWSRAGVALELAIVVAQVLTAVWFYRLFRPVNSVAAGAIAAFGLVNAVVVLVSAAMLGTAVQVSVNPVDSAAAVGDPAATVQLLYLVSSNMWTVGALFFGLWLIPMGWCVLRSGWMPRVLGWILMVGGVGYVLSPFVSYLASDAHVLFDAMAYPASVGEFWMVGYLLIYGVRHCPSGTPSAVNAP
jgi:hypothetical protein